MASDQRPQHADIATLDARIERTEQRLLLRQARLGDTLQRLGAQARGAIRPHRLAAPVAVGVALLLAWRLVRRRRPAPAQAAVARQRPRKGVLLSTLELAAMVWPFLPQGWRARAFPAGIAALVGAAWPKLRASAASDVDPPQPVAEADLARYAGTWHEVARLRDRFEGRRLGQPSVTYRMRDDDRGAEVVHRCPGHSGRARVAHGVARAVAGSRGARLKVTFAPRWLRALPFVWADHWILHLEGSVLDHYHAALVGTPDRGQLWILAREHVLPQAVLLRMLDIAAAKGFDLRKLIPSAPIPAGAPPDESGHGAAASHVTH